MSGVIASDLVSQDLIRSVNINFVNRLDKGLMDLEVKQVKKEKWFYVALAVAAVVCLALSLAVFVGAIIVGSASLAGVGLISFSLVALTTGLIIRPVLNISRSEFADIMPIDMPIDD